MIDAVPQEKKRKKRLRDSKRQVLTNGAVNWIGFAVQVVVTFITTPVFIKHLGDARYGIWSLVDSILAYLTLFDLGLTASVVRFTSKYEAVGDKLNRDRAFCTSIVLFAGIGLMALIVAMVVAGIGPWMFQVPDAFYTQSRWLFILLGVNLAIGLPMNVFPSILAGLGRYPTTTTIRTGCLIVRAVILIAVVVQGHGLIGVALAVTGMAVVENLLLMLAVRAYLPDFRFSFSLVDRETFREIKGYSIDAFIIAINHRLSFRTDPMVISFFLGPHAITPYIVGKKLVGYATSSLRAFTQVLTPAVSAWESKGETEKIKRLMIDGTRMVLWAIAPLEVGLLVLGKPFLTLWLGERLAELAYPPLALLALPLVLSLSQSISTRILFGTDGLRWLSIAGLIQSVSNLALSVLLVVPLGIVGVAIGTAIPYSIYNIAVEKHVCRRLGIGVGTFIWRAYSLPMAVAPFLALGWWWAMRMVDVNWANLVLVGVIGMSLYGVVAALLEWGPKRLFRGVRKKILSPPATAGQIET